MEAYQQRVIEEKADLSEKIGALTRFIDSNPTFIGLSDAERFLLRAQRLAMMNYYTILMDRIGAFKG